MTTSSFIGSGSIMWDWIDSLETYAFAAALGILSALTTATVWLNSHSKQRTGVHHDSTASQGAISPDLR